VRCAYAPGEQGSCTVRIRAEQGHVVRRPGVAHLQQEADPALEVFMGFRRLDHGLPGGIAQNQPCLDLFLFKLRAVESAEYPHVRRRGLGRRAARVPGKALPTLAAIDALLGAAGT
jgi:hypothetical protein